MKVRSYKDLSVWQIVMQLVVECYRVTDTFPRSEEFGLKSQMRRAAVSIPSNVAEGNVRHSSNEYCRFLSIALGSAAELETQIELARRRGWSHTRMRINSRNSAKKWVGCSTPCDSRLPIIASPDFQLPLTPDACSLIPPPGTTSPHHCCQ